jgi:endonuclease/exonuclease/phosphatase (EEP) superfamily protein YafD
LATLVTVALGLALARRYKISLLLLLAAALNLHAVLPSFMQAQAGTVQAGPSLRALSLNVRKENSSYEQVARILQHHAPNFFVLQEVNDAWLDALEDLRSMYPYSIEHPREDAFGMALFSKAPLKQSQIVYPADSEIPALIATIPVAGSTLTILAMHPPPPTREGTAKLRNAQLAGIPEMLDAFEGPVVVMGDLNISPWSYYFERLLTQTGLESSSRGRGVLPTWPAGLITPLRIPIDHFLHSKEIEVVSSVVGDDVGSDHLPVIVDFKLPSAQDVALQERPTS